METRRQGYDTLSFLLYPAQLFPGSSSWSDLLETSAMQVVLPTWETPVQGGRGGGGSTGMQCAADS